MACGSCKKKRSNFKDAVKKQIEIKETFDSRAKNRSERIEARRKRIAERNARIARRKARIEKRNNK